LASVLTALKAAKRIPECQNYWNWTMCLESEPPAASTAEVGDILQRRFELSGPVRALSSERDANFRVDTSAGPYLLKITNGS
jgi:Ser/Thr protein kinase RdoA (MazF antagonist)